MTDFRFSRSPLAVRPAFAPVALSLAAVLAAALLVGALPVCELGAADAPPAWDAWFAKNVTATSKAGYVHFFWNLEAGKRAFDASDKRTFVARAARELAATRWPAKATSDLVKVDVVHVAARDRYGEPRWDSMTRVAHLEFSRAKLLAALPADRPKLSAAELALFSKLELF